MNWKLYLFLLLSLPTLAKKSITLEDIFVKNMFRESYVGAIRFMNNPKYYSQEVVDDEKSHIVRFNLETGKLVDTIFNGNLMKIDSIIASFDSYTFNDDETKILLSTNPSSIYRHSYKAFYYVWDIKQNQLTPVSDQKISLAEFSPDGDKVGYVRDNNLYFLNLITKEETAISTDGKFNHLIYGTTDWVYEEEFSFTKGFFWSPNSSHIAYYRFDESEVKQFSMPIYGTENYPNHYTFKYPKAGETNANVSIHVYDLKKQVSREITLTDDTDFYIPKVRWTRDNNILSIIKLNRLQNELLLIHADISSNSTQVIYTEKSDTYINIEKMGTPTYLSDNRFIWLSEKSGFAHLYLFKANGNPTKQLTKGNWEVTHFYGLDERKKIAYFQSAEESPLERYIYSLSLSGEQKKLYVEKGNHQATFNKTFEYVKHSFSNSTTPSKVTIEDSKGTVLRIIENNSKLAKTVQSFSFQPQTFFSFKTSENIQLNGWMIKPSNFDKKKKYPVLMFVYGGPGHQTVINKWSSSGMQSWFRLLANKGFIVVSIDGRGTGARGAKFQKCTYLNLGKLEVMDQIEGAKYVSSLPYIDGNRIGIFGWSYGGFMSSLCILKGNDVFKLGIAVAPVTHWKFYDSIYTERYMQTPQKNKKGYDENAPIYFADQLKGKYLLIHGTADDNVHFQNAIAMSQALIKAGKQFDFYAYPDKTHGIGGRQTTIHLYTKMTQFIDENL